MGFVHPEVVIEGGGGGGGPCLLLGTRITTSDGSACVEDLSLGAMVLTASGESRPVRWLGHRELDCNRYRNPAVVWPICVKAGAFAENQPSRDLWVSPAHAILVEGVLIPAEKLVNGATIVQVPRGHVEYWHVELDSHDILLTEGLPTESYVDCGNRTAFVNGGAYLEAHPDFKPKHWTDTCVPLVLEGPAVQRAKAALLARAQALGYGIADGERDEPTAASA
jgi:Hint domain